MQCKKSNSNDDPRRVWDVDVAQAVEANCEFDVAEKLWAGAGGQGVFQPLLGAKVVEVAARGQQEHHIGWRLRLGGLVKPKIQRNENDTHKHRGGKPVNCQRVLYRRILLSKGRYKRSVISKVNRKSPRSKGFVLVFFKPIKNLRQLKRTVCL